MRNFFDLKKWFKFYDLYRIKCQPKETFLEIKRVLTLSCLRKLKNLNYLFFDN